MKFRQIALLLFLIVPFLGKAQLETLGFSVDAAINQMKESDQLELVLYSSHPSFREQLHEHQIPYQVHFESYYRVKVNAEQAGKLHQLKNIEFVEPLNDQGQALNDTMLVNNRIVGVHTGAAPLKKGYSGNGVVIGFIDSGIDFSHPDLQDTSGNTRVLRIWDQKADTLVSSRIPSFNYGQVWDSSDINAGNCPHDDDLLSHGTNVVGIASGNGNALNRYTGAAPESDIIMVATDFNASNWLETVADGVEYIFNEAESMGKPCVINISAGSYLGSHDGADLAALRIDSLIKARKGRVVVAAAGNAGNLKFHLGYDVTSDTSFTWFEYNPNSSLGTGAVYYQLWADTADFNHVEFSFGANRPSPSFQKRDQSPYINIQNRLQGVGVDSLFGDTNLLGIVQTSVQLMGDKYLMEVKIEQADSSHYLFSFIATGNGRFDVWSDQWLGSSHIYNDTLPPDTVLPEINYYQSPDTFQTMVSSFTCLPSVITVGNYINRTSYVDVNNTTQSFPVVRGKKSDNSSLGPNRRGLQKPDVIASGDYSMTANRLASIPLHIANNQADRIGQGGMHKRNGGTSMAAPVVAGIAALMMEECNDLDYGQIRQRITQHTYSDSLTGTLPNYGYGYGKVDASASLQDLYFTTSISPAGLIEVCEFDVVELSGPSHMSKYMWSTGDSTASISLDSAGIYSLIATDTAGCEGSSSSVEIRKWTNPAKPSISVIDENTLESSSALKYLWYLNGYPMTTERDQQLKIFVGGQYSVEVADVNDCKTHSDSVESFLNVLNIKKSPEVVLYPNPTGQGFFRIRCQPCHDGEEIRLEIYNLSGKLVMNRSVYMDETIPMPDKGFFQYRLMVDNKEISRGPLVAH